MLVLEKIKEKVLLFIKPGRKIMTIKIKILQSEFIIGKMANKLCF